MFAFLDGLSGLEKLFAICAVVGGLLFLIRILLQFAGGHLGDGDVHDISHADADASFKILSLQGITSFFMMFGLVGLALMKESKTSEGIAILGGTAAGCATVWIIGKIFSLMKGLQSSGTLNIEDAIGSEGSVNLTIPSEGRGKVQVKVRDRLREFEAETEGQEELNTGETIEVVRIVSGNVLIVRKL